MIEFKITVDDMARAQAIIKNLCPEDEEIDYRQERLIRKIYADLCNKVEDIQRARMSLRAIAHDYFPMDAEYAKEIRELEEKLDYEDIKLIDLEKLRNVFENLLDKEKVLPRELSEAYEILSRLRSFL